MNVHIALYWWKSSVDADEVNQVLAKIESLSGKVHGIVEVSTGANTSRYGEGYTHVILVRGETQEAIDAYRDHPDHQAVAAQIEAMEEQGIGVDFVTKHIE